MKDKCIKIAAKKGLTLNLDNPKTIQDKINWLKINDNIYSKSLCADKIKLHNFCTDRLGEDICVPILAVYDKPENIDFKTLPDACVFKCNHGYNMNIVCIQKPTALEQKEIIRTLKGWLAKDFGHESMQLQYSGIERKCYAETFLTDSTQKDSLRDYKFWCFNGKPMMYTINDGHGHGDIIYYDMDHKEMNLYGLKKVPEFRKPINFQKMKEYAEKLSAGFYFVRVDFYEVNGKIYLGEMTFTPGNGFFRYKDNETNLKIGRMLDIFENDGVSICLTAYNVPDYIKECLDSIQNQTWFKDHDNWEVLVGIDGCEKTAEVVAPLLKNYKNTRAFMMDKNVGTYITTNTMMSMAKYRNVLRFDSDDIMCPDMIEKIMENKDNYDAVRFHLQNFGLNNREYQACGQIFMKKSIFKEFGGYRPWPCSADSELLVRLKKYASILELDDILMLRRAHSESLTRNKKTNFKSNIRKKYLQFVRDERRRLKNKKNAVIICRTETCKEFFGEKTLSLIMKPAVKKVKFNQKANFHPLA